MYGARIDRELKQARPYSYGEYIGAFSQWGIILAAVAILCVLAFASQAGEFKSGEQARPDLCRGWIDVTCSCSHRSCWEARPGEFKDLNDGRWEERDSGQIKQQTGWSKDGVFIACAWRNGEPATSIQYYVGKGQPISCIFPPVKGF